jgi:hypothetical protein
MGRGIVPIPVVFACGVLADCLDGLTVFQCARCFQAQTMAMGMEEMSAKSDRLDAGYA